MSFFNSRYGRVTARSVFALSLSAVTLCSFAAQDVMAKQITLRVRTWWTGIDKLWEKDIFEPYMKANPNIKIDFKALPWSEYWQKQLLMLASGQVLGEVMLIDAKWTQDAIAGKFMIPLDPYIKRDRLDLSQFVQASLREYRKNLASSGPLYGLPLISSAQVLYYNKTIFAQAGMTAPDPGWTWEDAFGYAKKLTLDKNGDGKPDQWGWGNDWYTIDCMLKSYGSDLVTNDFSKAVVNNASALKALSLMVDAQRAKSIAGDSNAFYQGKIAMQNMGDWNMANFRNLKNKFDWDITIPPKGPAERSSLAYSNGFFIPPFINQEKRDEAWKLIKFIMTQPKKSDLGLLYLAMMPSYRPLTMSKEYLEGEPRCNRKAVLECNEKYAFTHAYPKNLEWHDKGWANEWQAALSLKKSPEQALAAAEKAMNVVINSWNSKKRK